MEGDPFAKLREVKITMTDVLEKKYKFITQARKDHWKVCVYGLGYLGQRLYLSVPQIFGLSPDIYSDGNDEKVDTDGYDGLAGVYKRELLALKEPVLVFVLADNPADREIEKTLSENENLHIVLVREIIQMEETIRSFYGDELYDKYVKLEEYSRKKAQ